METDLHAPLGQDRQAGRKRAGPFTAARMLAALAAVAASGLSIYAALPSPELRTTDPATIAAATTPPGETLPETAAADRPETGLQRSGPQSGARVESTLTGDGQVVTTYSPRPRDGDGPVLIQAGSRTQDPRLAGFPNDDLLEDSPDGRLPVVAADGLRPVDHYARPWSGARGARIAIVVSGLGLSQTGTQKAIRELPGEVTLAFAASGNSLQRWMQEARRKGHEILIQVPFEPFDYPANDPGPDTLLTDAGAAANLRKLHRTMARITNYTGIMNYMGGRFLAETPALEPVMRDIAGRGLLFLDDGSSARSQTGTLAKTLSMPHAFADLQLDAEIDRGAILRKLDELERIARRNGTAIGTAFAFDESIEAIARWSEEAGGRGIEVVGVAALAEP